MSKEAEILTCISCHDKHLCEKSRKSRGLCIAGVSVLQKVTLKVISNSYLVRSFLRQLEPGCYGNFSETSVTLFLYGVQFIYGINLPFEIKHQSHTLLPW